MPKFLFSFLSVTNVSFISGGYTMNVPLVDSLFSTVLVAVPDVPVDEINTSPIGETISAIVKLYEPVLNGVSATVPRNPGLYFKVNTPCWIPALAI